MQCGEIKGIAQHYFISEGFFRFIWEEKKIVDRNEWYKIFKLQYLINITNRKFTFLSLLFYLGSIIYMDFADFS